VILALISEAHRKLEGWAKGGSLPLLQALLELTERKSAPKVGGLGGLRRLILEREVSTLERLPQIIDYRRISAVSSLSKSLLLILK